MNEDAFDKILNEVGRKKKSITQDYLLRYLAEK
jgi:hypothetical protein